MADYRIRLRGGGVEATIAPEGELRLLAEGLEGFGRLDGAVAMAEYALYGGGYPTTRRLGSRRLRLHAELAPRFGTPAYRDLHARLMTLLDPTVDVELYVDMGGGARLLDVIPAGDGSVEVAHMGEPVAAQLSFLAAEPYFRAAAERHVSFWQAAPMLAFPLNLMAGAGTVSGYYGTTNAARLQNPGERECGYRLTLTAQNGTVQNPSVTLPGVADLCDRHGRRGGDRHASAPKDDSCKRRAVPVLYARERFCAHSARREHHDAVRGVRDRVSAGGAVVYAAILRMYVRYDEPYCLT